MSYQRIFFRFLNNLARLVYQYFLNNLQGA